MKPATAPRIIIPSTPRLTTPARSAKISAQRGPQQRRTEGEGAGHGVGDLIDLHLGGPGLRLGCAGSRANALYPVAQERFTADDEEQHQSVDDPGDLER